MSEEGTVSRPESPINGVENTTDLCSPFVELHAVTGASISVFGAAGHQSTICASDRLAAQVEEQQFDLGEGPHWRALRTGLPVLVPDLQSGAQPEWPAFASAMRHTRAAALFAFPLTMGAVTIGVVDLYRSSPGALDKGTVATALTLAASVAAPAMRRAAWSAGENALAEAQLAPELRREVHQATGMILVQTENRDRGIPPPESARILRWTERARRRSRRCVASTELPNARQLTSAIRADYD